MVGSSLSWGAQRGQLWKSSMSEKILSGGASMVSERLNTNNIGFGGSEDKNGRDHDGNNQHDSQNHGGSVPADSASKAYFNRS